MARPMSSSVAKIKGTSVGSFTIGVKGVTLYQGPSPIGITPKEGDIFIQTGSTPNFLQYNGTAWLTFNPSAPTTPAWAEVTTDAPVTANTKYFVNTSANPITVTFPTSPNMGDTISFIDAVGTFGTNNLTVNFNGSKFQANTSTVTANASGMSIDFIYYNSTYGWTVLNGPTYGYEVS